jgi:hypothetical protein
MFQFGLAFVLLYEKDANEKETFWFRFSMIYFTLAIGLTFVHQAATRLPVIANVFVMVLLGANIRKRRVKIGALIWLIILSALIMNQNIKGISESRTWFGRWQEILSETDDRSAYMVVTSSSNE